MAKDHVFDSIERLHQVLSLVHGVQKLRRRSEHERIRVRVEAHGRGNCAERFCPLAGFFQQRAMADVDPIEKPSAITRRSFKLLLPQKSS